MLLKRQVKNRLYDVLHYGTVYMCMGVTVLSTAYLGFYGYKYYTDIKPNRKIEELQKIKEGDIVDTTKTIAS